MIYVTDMMGFDERGLKLFLFESSENSHYKTCSFFIPYFDLDAWKLEFECGFGGGIMNYLGYGLFIVHLFLFGV